MSYPTIGNSAPADDVRSVVTSQLAFEDIEQYPGHLYTSDSATVDQSAGDFPQPASPPKTPRSRHGFGGRKGIVYGGAGLSVSNASRPQSAVSRRSATNAPSITANAFFRPMSSQRLQAQRSSRPFTAASEDIPDVPRLSTSSMTRQSLDSNNTVMPRHEPLPPSRGTEHTERDRGDRVYYNSSLNEENTINTIDSLRPLHETSQNYPVTSDAFQRTPKTPKTPKSFSSSFTRPSPLPQTRTSASQGGRNLRETSSPQAPEKIILSNRSKMGKNYEYFTGNTVFCWGGRLQNTRHRPVNVLTGLLIVVPAALFFTFSAPWLWHNVSPALPIVLAYLFLICLSSFLHASATDPGILPRNLHPLPTPDGDDPLAIGPAASDWTMVKSTNPNMTAMDVPTKYCKTCNIWRPLRAHHCRLCDSCIETQDHHCVWLNNCVGRRNYRYFFTFVSSAVVLGLLLSLESLGHLIVFSSVESISFRESINKLRVPFAMFIYGVLVIPYPVSLMGYHLFLVGRSETTREYLNSHKFPQKDRHRPFSQRTLVANWLAVFLRSQTPTYLRFKDEHTEGDPRFGPRRGQRQTPLSKEQQGRSMEMQDVSTEPVLEGFPSSMPTRF